MTKPNIAPAEIQPKDFAFSKENEKKIKAILMKYPKDREQSAIMPLLDLAQRQHDNWIPEAAMRKIAEIVGVPQIKVFEVATFYTMYNLAPVGKYHLQLCTTTPCWLCGSKKLQDVIEKKAGIKAGQTSEDGLFTLTEVECLGACVNAPMMQINDDYYEDLDEEKVSELLDIMQAGKKLPQKGSQKGRLNSMPAKGATCLEAEAKKHKIQTAKG